MLESLRTRIAAGSFVVLTLILLLTGAALYYWTESGLIREREDALGQITLTFAAAIEIEPDEVELELSDDYLKEQGRAFNTSYRLYDPGGKLLLGNSDDPLKNGGHDSHKRNDFTFYITTNTDGSKQLFCDYLFAPRTDSGLKTNKFSGKQFTLRISQDIREIESTLNQLFRNIIIIGLLGALAGSFCIMSISGLIVKPVNKMADAISGIDDDALGRKIEIANLPSELRPVIEQINQMLTRLETAFDREKKFTSNVSHELRTPISGLRATLEVLNSKKRTSEEYASASENCLSIVLQLQSLIESLLELKSLESSNAQLKKENTNLTDFIRNTREDFFISKNKKEKVVDELDDNLLANIDRPYFKIILNNLLDNAVSYSSPDTEIKISGKPEGDKVQISISNHCPKLNRADTLKHAFDPFWRADEARTDTGVHSGLGLSIVRSICELHEIDIQLDLGEDGVFKVDILI